mgnify:CR=1 FL=1
MAHAKTTGDGIEISSRKDIHKLQSKAVGLVGVLFLAVTGAAPMSAMLGNVPFAAGYGIGIYTPAAFLLATIVLTIFSIGYAAMASRVAGSDSTRTTIEASRDGDSWSCRSIIDAPASDRTWALWVW